MFAESYVCVNRNTFELTGLLVRRLDSVDYAFFVATSKRDASAITYTLSVEETPDLSSDEDVAFVALPPFLSPKRAFMNLACAALHVPRLPKIVTLTSELPSEAVIRQWALLAFLDDFGIRLRGANQAVVIGLIRKQALATTDPPFSDVPRMDEFQRDDGAQIPELEKSPIRIERYCANRHPQVKNLMEEDNSGAFDAADISSLDEELKLSIRSDLLEVPIVAGDHLYASAEYWTCLAIGVNPPLVTAFIGLLTFYQVENECWMGYLLECGPIMTEIALRRAIQRGYEHLLVWTTKSNTKAQKFYLGIGFVEAKDIHPRDTHGATDDWIAFRLSTA